MWEPKMAKGVRQLSSEALGLRLQFLRHIGTWCKTGKTEKASRHKTGEIGDCGVGGSVGCMIPKRDTTQDPQDPARCTKITYYMHIQPNGILHPNCAVTSKLPSVTISWYPSAIEGRDRPGITNQADDESEGQGQDQRGWRSWRDCD
jgi:hypothetical protein